jgi:ABC-type transporter Mla MlaB component
MDSLTVRIRGPLSRGDLPGLYRRVCGLLAQSEARLIRCDVSDIAVDAVALDALARLQVAARRRGAALELLGAPAELRDLIKFVGLDSALRSRGAEEARRAGRDDRWRGST